MHGGQHLSDARKAEVGICLSLISDCPGKCPMRCVPHHKVNCRMRQLRKTAEMVATFGKGITACDEGPGTVGDRFEKVGIENTEENRRLYR